MTIKRHYMWMISLMLVLLSCQGAWAAFGEDIEAPKPKFTQEGDQWTTEMIPRGKSTPVRIRFQAASGTLTDLAVKEFTSQDIPLNIDLKNYRSGFFLLDLTPSTPGGEVSVSLTSNYFNSGTDIWGFTDRSSRTWGSINPRKASGLNKEYTLTCSVKDGGPLDEDRKADGRIQLIIGPRDSFWGYALGTLFIRFFGVFLVLAVLEVGMIISGKIFQSMEKKGTEIADSGVSPKPEKAAPKLESAPDLTPEIAAAIAVALNLEANDKGTTPSIKPLTPMARPTVAAAAPEPKPAPKPAEPKASSGNPENAMKAPIPGVIIDIKVAVGDKVMEGETLIILEAMKMENDLIAEKSGIVTEILVQKGQQVSTGDSLLVIA